MPRFSIVALFVFIFACPLHAEDWREFRGPSGQGTYDGKNLPIEWGTTKNVAWNVKIPGKGWSSPIIEKGRLYLTSAVPIAASKDLSLSAFCLDAANGKLIWQKEVFRQDGAKAPKIHGKNSHASPTPITDGKFLFVHFGHQGTACLSLDGAIVWKTTEHKYSPVHGNGGTPIFVDDKLVFSADGGDKQFIIALDKTNGKTAWKTPRNGDHKSKFSFSTPLLIHLPGGTTQLISSGSGVVAAFDPTDGKEIWRVKTDGYSVIPRPVFGHGMIFLGTGYNTPSIYAIKVDGQGDVTETHVAWKTTKGAPHTPSLLLIGNEVYAVSDAGLATCFDAKTGKVHWQERVPGKYSASPFYADGKVYLQSEEGTTTVLRAGSKFEVLATNNLTERTFACYAVADGAIYLRTETQLYRIQGK